MRIRVDFTMEVAPECLDALRELSGCESLSDMRMFVSAEAEEHVTGYLQDNYVPNKVIRRANNC